MSTKLFVALDFSDLTKAETLYRSLRSLPVGFKIGLELFTAGGAEFVKKWSDEGADVFLDLKFHDIPNTVARALANVCQLKPAITNIHMSGGEAMVREAVSAVKGTGTKLIGVTVLTSLDSAALSNVGVILDPLEWALQLARLAKDWGLDGVVCSPHEVAAIKNSCGKDFLTIVPGIRLGKGADDQKRTDTPARAKASGADYIVVGRPITQAGDPFTAAQKFLAEIS